MAVEAHHHLLHTTGGPQKQLGWEAGGAGIRCDAAPAPCYYGGGGRDVGKQAQLQQGYQQQLRLVPVMMGQAADASYSGITFNGAQVQEVVSRKRKRAAELPQILGLGVAAHLQQQLVDVDRLVQQHTGKMWAELTEQRRRHARQMAAAVEAAAAKRLRAKDEEMERVARLNWALEERARSLSVEAQVWRDLAQSNEAAANALRAELQHALDSQARRGLVVSAADDAASCCCGENGAPGEEVGIPTGRRRCVVCGEGKAEVLLLPCRHLCACAACAAAAPACPACGCPKNGSVCVNFS